MVCFGTNYTHITVALKWPLLLEEVCHSLHANFPKVNHKYPIKPSVKSTPKYSCQKHMQYKIINHQGQCRYRWCVRVCLCCYCTCPWHVGMSLTCPSSQTSAVPRSRVASISMATVTALPAVKAIRAILKESNKTRR